MVAVHATREDKSRRGCRACALAGGLDRDPRAPTHLVIFLSPPLVLRRCGRVAARPATVIGRGAAAFLWRRRRFGRGPADAADHRRARRAAVARGQWRGVGLEAGRGWRATAGAGRPPSWLSASHMAEPPVSLPHRPAAAARMSRVGPTRAEPTRNGVKVKNCWIRCSCLAHE